MMSGSDSFLAGVDHALDVLRMGAGADASELFLLDSAESELLLTGCTGPDVATFCCQERFDLGRGYPGIVAARRSGLSSDRLQRDPRYLRRAVQALGYHTATAVPILRGERVLGTLHLAWKRPNPALDRAWRLLAAAAPLVATALAAGLAELTGGDGAVGESSEQALCTQAERFRRLAGADEASVILFSADARGVGGCGSTGPIHLVCEKLATSGVEGCSHSDVMTRGVVLHGRRLSWPAACRTLPRGFARVIAVPLRDGSVDVGVAYVGWRKAPPGPSTRFLLPLRSLARNLAPELRPPSETTALPSVLAPVTAAGTQHLRLQCFGPFTVFLDGTLVHRRTFSRSKSIDLLKMLILRRGRPISRDALVERLWPGAELEAGARSLHVAMHALRRAIEPEVAGRQWEHVLSRGDSFLIDLGSNCTLDLRDWRDLLASFHTATAAGEHVSERTPLLERAIGLYRGELFADDQDAEWCLADRQAYQNEFLEVLVRLSELYEGQGATDRSLSLLRRAVRVDPLREDLHRRLIMAFWQFGRLDEARRQYARCVEILRYEGGVQPSSETLNLGLLVGRRTSPGVEPGLCK